MRHEFAIALAVRLRNAGARPTLGQFDPSHGRFPPRRAALAECANRCQSVLLPGRRPSATAPGTLAPFPLGWRHGPVEQRRTAPAPTGEPAPAADRGLLPQPRIRVSLRPPSPSVAADGRDDAQDLALVERTPHAPAALQRPEPQLVVCDAEAPAAHALAKQHAVAAGLGYGWGRNAPSGRDYASQLQQPVRFGPRVRGVVVGMDRIAGEHARGVRGQNLAPLGDIVRS